MCNPAIQLAPSPVSEAYDIHQGCDNLAETMSLLSKVLSHKEHCN